MTPDQMLDHMRRRFLRCIATAAKKNRDYAGDADPFANFRLAGAIGVDPRRGILVRITDKLSRISQLLDREAAVEDESLQDTIDDAVNYLAILGALIDSER
jgi:hypothetical protein